MAKIRLTQPGFEHYSGQMGVLDFVDGLSIADVSENDARRLGAVMRVEWEDGKDPGDAQRILDNMHTPAPHFEPGAHPPEQPSEDHQTADEKAAALQAAQAAQAAQVDLAAVAKRVYTQQELEAIADQKGIKGLREVVANDPNLAGIKGTSIKELIAEILKGKPLEH